MIKIALPFPDYLLNTSVVINKLSGLNEDGENISTKLFEGMCIFHDHTKKVMTSDRQLVEANGTIVLKGAPYAFTLDDSYEVIIMGVKREVFNIHRPTNPDGTVFSTELSLS